MYEFGLGEKVSTTTDTAAIHNLLLGVSLRYNEYLGMIDNIKAV